MTLAPIKTPLVAKKLFPNYIWDVLNHDKAIYLTFDDGPTPEITEWVLETLKKHGAKATFFCIGNNVEKHPDIFQKVLAEGHTIGNHTQNHIKGWKSKTKDYLENVALCEATIMGQIPKSENQISNSKLQIPDSTIINQQSLIINLFRPPYGQITPKQGKKLIELGYKIIMWDVLSFDWENDLDEKKCLENVIEKTTTGSIIVFHDSVKASKNMQYVLPKVLEHFSKKGYAFKSLNF